MTADVNPTVNRRLERTVLVRWDDCCERLAAEYELAWAKPQHNQCVRRVCGRDQRTVINVLQIPALRARHGRTGIGLAQNRVVVGRRAGTLTRAGHVRAASRDVQVVDDCADHVGVLNRTRDPMAVVDKEPEAEHDEHPTRDQRDLRDERRLRIPDA